MNKVSELNLALAVHHAGGIPSMMSYCYNNKYDFFRDVEIFQKETNFSDIILAIDNKDLIHPFYIKKIIELKVSHIVPYINENPLFSDAQKRNIYNTSRNILSTMPCKVIELYLEKDMEVIENRIYLLKGNDGAGRGHHSTKELFEHYINTYPKGNFVPVGGIGTPQDVKHYLDAGAVAVGVGTMFAASFESNLSIEAKTKIVNSSSKNLERLDSNKNQQGLIFDRIDKDDENNTQSLKLGIATGTKGHVFLGKAVDHIHSIRTAQEVVDYLTSAIKT
jgi:nitronate monooxygenase